MRHDRPIARRPAHTRVDSDMKLAVGTSVQACSAAGSQLKGEGRAEGIARSIGHQRRHHEHGRMIPAARRAAASSRRDPEAPWIDGLERPRDLHRPESVAVSFDHR